MRVINREGESVAISLDEIRNRVSRLCSEEESAAVDLDTVAITTLQGFYDRITTSELDEMSARVCASMQSTHPAYDSLAAKILASNLHKNVRHFFGWVADGAVPFSFKIAETEARQPGTYNAAFLAFVRRNAAALDALIVHARDAGGTYFGMRTLERSYLIRCGDVVVETPQDVWLRVAIAVNMPRLAVEGVEGGETDEIVEGGEAAALARIKESYDGMSQGLFTHATPTLFNAGSLHEQLSSCFLLGTDDALDGIYKTIGDCAQISKWAGGIGLHVSNVRAKGSRINSTNGASDGIVPMLKVFNETMRYCNQAGRRKGSAAIYLEPWHADVWEFVELRRNVGSDTERTRDLFLALWVPDALMRRVTSDADWYLMSPDACPGLVDAVGADFEALYGRYVDEGRYVRKLKARELWQHVITSQLETGTPYVLFKDAVNRKSNHANLGVIRSSNLCVAPETHLLTRGGGYLPVGALKDQDVEVWNGGEWSATTVRQTGEKQPLLRVTFSNGEELACTPYHKFYVRPEGDSTGRRPAVVVEAKDLEVGATIDEFAMPPPLDDAAAGFRSDLEAPYEAGCAAAARSSCSRDTFAVPADQTLDVKLRWLEGLADSDGSLHDTSYLQITYGAKPDMVRVKRMLNTMGVDAIIRDANLDDSLLLLPPVAVRTLVGLGFRPQTLDPSGVAAAAAPDAGNTTGTTPGTTTGTGTVTVTGVHDDGRVDDTFCVNEPLRHKALFNGILTSNCAEVTQYSDAEQYAVCNLASIAVNRFAAPPPSAGDRGAGPSAAEGYDFAALHAVAKTVARSLDRVIDINFYPRPEAERSNKRSRPIGIGIQGVADLLCLCHLPYETEAAAQLEADIMETIYHGALEASADLAEELGPYPAFDGSPFSRGQLQFDLWDAEAALARAADPAVAGQVERPATRLSGRWDWDALRARVVSTGVRNSLLTALMPTASTSQLLGNNECFEPMHSNVFKRTTLAGEFMVVNKHLMRDLIALGRWTEAVRQQLLRDDGSVQNIAAVPAELKAVYKTVWEVSQRSIIDHALRRGPFVDQSQSQNLFFGTPSFTKLSSALIYGWQNGAKCGVYYLRSKPAQEATKRASATGPAPVGPAVVKTQPAAQQPSKPPADGPACRRDDPDCMACSA
jgi:ribonucleoside-diphosphate reductase alpha chain